jgi:hypothetical protein
MSTSTSQILRQLADIAPQRESWESITEPEADELTPSLAAMPQQKPEMTPEQLHALLAGDACDKIIS